MKFVHLVRLIEYYVDRVLHGAALSMRAQNDIVHGHPRGLYSQLTFRLWI